MKELNSYFRSAYMVCTTRKLKQYNENIARNTYVKEIPRVHFLYIQFIINRIAHMLGNPCTRHGFSMCAYVLRNFHAPKLLHPYGYYKPAINWNSTYRASMSFSLHFSLCYTKLLYLQGSRNSNINSNFTLLGFFLMFIRFPSSYRFLQTRTT